MYTEPESRVALETRLNAAARRERTVTTRNVESRLSPAVRSHICRFPTAQVPETNPESMYLGSLLQAGSKSFTSGFREPGL